jgi:hypothetical protein
VKCVENEKYVKYIQVSDLTKIVREDLVLFLFCSLVLILLAFCFFGEERRSVL